MNWIVRLALNRPYTVGVMSLLVLILGVLSLQGMIIDIFPSIDIPVVGIVWSYPGLSADEVEKRVVFLSERSMSTTVNGIERIESQSIPGVGLLKVYFQPGTDIGAAIAQISSTASTLLRQLPPGMQPPVIIQSNASNLPVAQLTISSKTMPEEQLFDYGQNFVRLRLFTIPGLSTPSPYGGKLREILIDIDPDALQAHGISAADVVAALQASNVIIPTGTARMGNLEYDVGLNSSPTTVKQFSSIPIKVVGNRAVMIGDVAHVTDGFATQTNMVHVNGQRATYMAILRKAGSSTLAVVDAAREAIPGIKATAPAGMDFNIDFDQSKFVRAAINNVLVEAATAAFLVSLVILLFLGSWRSVVIVCMSIPLAILTAVICLNLTGNSLNLMTLGGLSLSIGILVDNATIAVENIHRNRHLGKPLTIAILEGTRQIAVPAIVATLSICIVFSPVALLTGPSRFLFTPMALAVVVAILSSYILSFTLVPTLSRMLMAGEHGHDENMALAATGFFARFFKSLNARRENLFDRIQAAYGRVLAMLLAHRMFALGVSVAIVVVTAFLPGVIGEDFFPTTDAGMMRLHFRAPTGTRIEVTDSLVAQLEGRIRDIIPKTELKTINDMIGVPLSPTNLAFVQTDNVNGMDAEILIALQKEHRPTVEYMKRIREKLAGDFPGCSIFFQPADIVNQVLNFGLSAPIDVQIEYPDVDRAFVIARQVRDAMLTVSGATDVNIKQVIDYPMLHVDVDRTRAAELGVSQRDVANSMLISLSSSTMVSPSYFLNPTNSVNYLVAVQTPMRVVNSVDRLLATPITPLSSAILLPTASAEPSTQPPGAPAQTLSNIATVQSEVTTSQFSHYTVQRVLDITANVEGRDLGSVAGDIQRKISTLQNIPQGAKISIRGQNDMMSKSFASLGLGGILATMLVYLLMVMLYQSWLDPFIIMIAVIGAVVGILWMLALTGTTINVVSMMGSIMAVGIAVSNSILVVSFANDIRVEHEIKNALKHPHNVPQHPQIVHNEPWRVVPVAFESMPVKEAALEAGKTRLRPVLMTALAMILGMVPMALSLGEGGEQNAPLGRAVIGGLLVATPVTLFIVPVVYSLLRSKLPTKHLLQERFHRESTEEEIAQ